MFLKVTLLFLMARLAWALPKPQIQQTESFFLKEIQTAPLNKKFYLTLLAAKELEAIGEEQKAISYYQRTLGFKTSEDKSRAYIKLLYLYQKNKNQGMMTRILNDAKRYYKVYPSYLTGDIKNWMNLFEVKRGLDKKSSSELLKDLEKVEIGGLHIKLTENYFHKLIKERQYEKALSLLERQKVSSSPLHSLKLKFDLLNILVRKDLVKNLECVSSTKKFPDSYAYSILICDLLDQYLQTKKVDKQKLAKIRDYFLKNDQDKSFLLETLKDLPR